MPRRSEVPQGRVQTLFVKTTVRCFMFIDEDPRARGQPSGFRPDDSQWLRADFDVAHGQFGIIDAIDSPLRPESLELASEASSRRGVKLRWKSSGFHAAN